MPTNVRPDAAHAQLQNRALVRENSSTVGPASRRKNLLKDSAKNPPRRPPHPTSESGPRAPTTQR